MAVVKKRVGMLPVVDKDADEDKSKGIQQFAQRRKSVLGSAPASAGFMQNFSRKSRGNAY